MQRQANLALEDYVRFGQTILQNSKWWTLLHLRLNNKPENDRMKMRQRKVRI